MKYICPTCGKEFDTEEKVSKHFLQCWKNNNPHHKSKPAPHSENINTTEINEEMALFFNSLNGGVNNARNDG